MVVWVGWHATYRQHILDLVIESTGFIWSDIWIQFGSFMGRNQVFMYIYIYISMYMYV